MSNKGWIGVDLDGTLAHYNGWKGAGHIGEPIAPMVERVKKWLGEGRDVRIFTARVSHDGTARRIMEAQRSVNAIEKWCFYHLGIILPITCCKDFGLTELWDDRAVQVIHNVGEPVGEEAIPEHR